MGVGPGGGGGGLEDWGVGEGGEEVVQGEGQGAGDDEEEVGFDERPEGGCRERPGWVCGSDFRVGGSEADDACDACCGSNGEGECQSYFFQSGWFPLEDDGDWEGEKYDVRGHVES